jgi:biopolymer transport protein ExbD
VQANIERLHAENPQGTVVIQADKKATTDTLIKVMDASRSAGIEDVSIATDEL